LRARPNSFSVACQKYFLSSAAAQLYCFLGTTNFFVFTSSLDPGPGCVSIEGGAEIELKSQIKRQTFRSRSDLLSRAVL
jgi:hypothetical protein